MTTDERLLSLERSVSFHKKTTLAVLLLCACFLATGLTANQEAEDITVKSITIVGNDGKPVAVIQKDEESDVIAFKNPNSTGARVGIMTGKDQSGVAIAGPTGMILVSSVVGDFASMMIMDSKLEEGGLRASISANRPDKKLNGTSSIVLTDRYGDRSWAQVAR